MYKEPSFYNQSFPEHRENLPREIEAKIVNLGDADDFLKRLEKLGAKVIGERRLLSDRLFRKFGMASDQHAEFIFDISRDSDVAKWKEILDFLGVEVLNQEKEEELNLRAKEDVPTRTVRLRRDGDKLFLTVKEKRVYQENIDNRIEIEIEVPDDDSIIYLLNSVGYIQKLQKEKFRTSFELDGGTVEFNEGPVGPPWAEIEAASEEKVLDIAKKLGYSTEDLKGMSDMAYYEEYGPALDLDDLENMTFERMKDRDKK